MPEPIALSPRLQKIFSETKLVCFGRYALEVPAEAQFTFGTISVPGKVEIVQGGGVAGERRYLADIKKIKEKDETAEITYSGVGPVKNSWQIHFSEDVHHRENGLFYIDTYINLGEFTFIFGDSTEEGETQKEPLARQATIARNLRLRPEDEIPSEPGFCLERAFLGEDTYSDQEMVNAGIHLPSFPDVKFSVRSNKDAYADYPPEEFETRLRGQLSLLTRINKAKKSQGLLYPKRSVLREGKRHLHHWRGEESLFVRPDGTHDFEWALVGTPRDVANPSEFSAGMFTKVAHNSVGAAKSASLSDEEAVALWDKLLSGLKFRVWVPGSPSGSYFLDPKK